MNIYGLKIDDRDVFLQDKNLEDLDGLEKYTNIKFLKLCGNKNIKSYSILSKLSLLEELEIEHCGLTSLDQLGYLPELHTLRCGHNLLKNLSGIENFPKLRSIVCWHNQIENIDDIPNEMFFVNCSYNNIVSLKSLSGKSINHIYCLGESYENLDGIQHIKNLSQLNIDDVYNEKGYSSFMIEEIQTQIKIQLRKTNIKKLLLC